ncbi:MAG: hypothetical protein AB7L90_03720 [Hyphomicrobiaceae bacterium]
MKFIGAIPAPQRVLLRSADASNADNIAEFFRLSFRPVVRLYMCASFHAAFFRSQFECEDRTQTSSPIFCRKICTALHTSAQSSAIYWIE